jgi:hypothetical protein
LLRTPSTEDVQGDAGDGDAGAERHQRMRELVQEAGDEQQQPGDQGAIQWVAVGISGARAGNSRSPGVQATSP